MPRQTRSRSKAQLPLHEKCTSLYHAILDRDHDTAEQFLKAGALPDYVCTEDNNFCYTPFHAALPKWTIRNREIETNKHIKLLDLLYKYCSSSTNIFTPCVHGLNPFETAIADGYIKCTKWFINILKTDNKYKKISSEIINRENVLPSTPSNYIHAKRKQNQIPIHIAVKSETETIIELLCDKFNVNCGKQNIDGMNSMHIAVERKLPNILIILLKNAKKNDILNKKYKNMNVLQYSKYLYHQSLIKPIKPNDINRLYKCYKLIKTRIDSPLSLDKEWKNVIKMNPDPLYNAVIVFWDINNERNPNSNSLIPALIPTDDKQNEIHRDVDKIIADNPDQYKNTLETMKLKYRCLSIKEAMLLQHQDPKYITTYCGDINIDNRCIFKQKLSIFAKQFKLLLYKRNKQISSNDHDEKEKDDNNNNKNDKRKCISSPIIKYKNECIVVEAINDKLEEELTTTDRIKFYEISHGLCCRNKKIEIKEILDPIHPCKRDNQDQSVFGLFAKEHIYKREIMLEYCGLFQTKQEYISSINGLERHDGQFRTIDIDTFSSKNTNDTNFLINSSYYSNECVFVNDATKDSIFKKWNKINASFFEILINGWPHIFLRAYEDIQKGDEILTSYGVTFWKTFNDDIAVSQQLQKYYKLRLKRDKDAKLLKQKHLQTVNNNNNDNDNCKQSILGHKRKRSIVPSDDDDVEQQPLKRRKLNEISCFDYNYPSGSSFSCSNISSLDRICEKIVNENNNNNNKNYRNYLNQLRAIKEELIYKNNKLMKMIIDSDIKYTKEKENENQMISSKENLIYNRIIKSENTLKMQLKQLQNKYDILESKSKKQQKQIKQLTHNHTGKYNDLSQQKADILRNVENIINQRNYYQLKNEDLTKKFHTALIKKKNYKDKCRQYLKQRDIGIDGR